MTQALRYPAGAQPDCRDCAATTGEKHDQGCDMARCLHTGQQRLACRALGHLLGQEEHDCGEDIWRGYEPDQEQAARHDLWVHCPPAGSPVRCGPDHPDAIPDVNRLMRNGRWDREQKQWILMDGAPIVNGETGDYNYDAGYRDGENSLSADIRYQFSGEPGAAQTTDELLEFFRTLTGDRGLEWPS